MSGKLIKNLSKKKAIIISTHILDMPEVCNKCLIINEGKKVFEGHNQLKEKLVSLWMKNLERSLINASSNYT